MTEPILPAGPYLPTNGLVALAWLAQRVPGLNDSMVGSTLPRDMTKWAGAGFVQAVPVTGLPGRELPTRHPVVQVDAWAVALSSDGSVNREKPPWAKAARLAELVVAACENDVQLFSRPVVMPENYHGARVLAAYPTTEPASVLDDPSGYARVTFDLAIDWHRFVA
jgi:hypothetical protein